MFVLFCFDLFICFFLRCFGTISLSFGYRGACEFSGQMFFAGHRYKETQEIFLEIVGISCLAAWLKSGRSAAWFLLVVWLIG